MMKFNNYLLEIKSYNNWIFPNLQTQKMDFEEYKSKENSKWKSRAEIIGSRFPIFKDFNEFQESLKSAKVINFTEDMLHKIRNCSDCSSIEDLKSLVKTYKMPRDVDRIIKGFENNDKIPMPIVIKGSRAMWKFSGNTRTNSARILGIIPKVLLVDVSK